MREVSADEDSRETNIQSYSSQLHLLKLSPQKNRRNALR